MQDNEAKKTIPCPAARSRIAKTRECLRRSNLVAGYKMNLETKLALVHGANWYNWRIRYASSLEVGGLFFGSPKVVPRIDQRLPEQLMDE